MSYSADKLLPALQQAPAAKRYVVALSGGLDSVVLLHSLCALRAQGLFTSALSALHINHNLSPSAQQWQAFCQQTCADWQVSLQTEAVEVNASGSLETAARNSRYQAFRELLQADELLLMAHHLDDQIETVLFRLIRGAGAQGLTGIPAQRQLGSGRLLRPLLQYGRAELAAYAAMHQLAWQEDESNSDQQHDRNYLRHQVLPQIEQRWPDYRQSWRKSLALLSENDDLQKQLGAIDLRDATTEMGGISVAVMQGLGSARQRNLLRCWLQQLGVSDPGWNTLHQFVSEFIPGVSRGSKFALESCDVYQHQAQLFAVRPLPEPGLEAQTLRLDDGAIDFSLNGNGRLRIEASQGEGICPLPHALQVKYREGGESLKLKGRPQKKLKQLLQESGMPPWQRQRVPLLFADAELVCVPGVGIAESYLAQSGQNARQVVWAAPTQLLTPKP